MRYYCGLCKTTSRPYSTRAGVNRHAWEHRDAKHNGDCPDGEAILPNEPASPRDRLLMGGLVAFLAVMALCKLLGIT